MNQITPVIKLFTHQDKQSSGLYISALILEHNGNCYHLQGGTRDTIHVFTQGVCIFTLTINKTHGYIGFNAYMTPEPDPINTIFLQSNRDIKDTLGNKWENLSPKSIVRKLIDCLC